MNAEEIWPHVHDAPTFTAMCRKLNDLGVLGLPASVKRPIALDLCDRLGFEPSEKSFRGQLIAGAHTAERVRKARAANAAYQVTPGGREKVNASSRVYKATSRSTPEGREKARAASRAANRATRATEDGLEKSRAAVRALGKAYHQPGGRYETDPLYRLTCIIRSGVRRISKAPETAKSGSRLVLPDGTSVSWRELLGCSMLDANRIIESRFLPGMTWKNQGKVWHLDHYFPIRAYQDTPTLDVLKIVQHIDNLWPLWGPENLEKGDKYCPHELAALLAQRAAA